jgi:hypothetical protein
MTFDVFERVNWPDSHDVNDLIGWLSEVCDSYEEHVKDTHHPDVPEGLELVVDDIFLTK